MEVVVEDPKPVTFRIVMRSNLYYIEGKVTTICYSYTGNEESEANQELHKEHEPCYRAWKHVEAVIKRYIASGDKEKGTYMETHELVMKELLTKRSSLIPTFGFGGIRLSN